MPRKRNPSLARYGNDEVEDLQGWALSESWPPLGLSCLYQELWEVGREIFGRGALLEPWRQVRTRDSSWRSGCLYLEKPQLDPEGREQPDTVCMPAQPPGEPSVSMSLAPASATDLSSLLHLQPKSSFVPDGNRDLPTLPSLSSSRDLAAPCVLLS